MTETGVPGHGLLRSDPKALRPLPAEDSTGAVGGFEQRQDDPSAMRLLEVDRDRTPAPIELAVTGRRGSAGTSEGRLTLMTSTPMSASLRVAKGRAPRPAVRSP